jgi:hypothetical protein
MAKQSQSPEPSQPPQPAEPQFKDPVDRFLSGQFEIDLTIPGERPVRYVPSAILAEEQRKEIEARKSHLASLSDFQRSIASCLPEYRASSCLVIDHPQLVDLGVRYRRMSRTSSESRDHDEQRNAPLYQEMGNCFSELALNPTMLDEKIIQWADEMFTLLGGDYVVDIKYAVVTILKECCGHLRVQGWIDKSEQACTDKAEEDFMEAERKAIGQILE